MKCQSNLQEPSQGPQQLILQIDPSRYPGGFPRDTPSIMSVSPVFVESSGDPSGSTSDKPTKNPSPVKTTKSFIVPSETPTKYPPHGIKELSIANPSNKLIGYPSGDQKGVTSTITTGKPSSNPRSHPISDQYFRKRGSQEVQVSLKIYLILFILHDGV